jgi:hypothetical protein
VNRRQHFDVLGRAGAELQLLHDHPVMEAHERRLAARNAREIWPDDVVEDVGPQRLARPSTKCATKRCKRADGSMGRQLPLFITARRHRLPGHAGRHTHGVTGIYTDSGFSLIKRLHEVTKRIAALGDFAHSSAGGKAHYMFPRNARAISGRAIDSEI